MVKKNSVKKKVVNKVPRVPKVKVPRVKKEAKGTTPIEIINAMNEAHQEWKTTKQVKYDINGRRLED